MSSGAVGTCKDCHHYRPCKIKVDIERHGPLAGHCLSSFIAQADDSTYAEPMENGAVYVGVGGAAAFVTGPDFGCINFVQKR